MHEIVPRVVLEVEAELGEGPVWDREAGALWFVDIKNRRLHRLDPARGHHRSWTAPDQIGFAQPRALGGLVAGLKTGLHWFDPETGDFTFARQVEPEAPGNRLNDSYVDPHGRLWFGSMDDAEEAPSGALYRWDGESLVKQDGGFSITNGPCMSPDRRTFYHTDTLGKRVSAFDVLPDGTLANKRLFVEIEEGAGYPDGSCVDSEGCVWVALFGGWGVRRYGPDGALRGFVRFPCPNVTKIAFGGEGLTTAYATTARLHMSPEAREASPLAGALFAFDAPAPGMPAHRFGS